MTHRTCAVTRMDRAGEIRVGERRSTTSGKTRKGRLRRKVASEFPHGEEKKGSHGDAPSPGDDTKGPVTHPMAGPLVRSSSKSNASSLRNMSTPPRRRARCVSWGALGT